MIDQIGKKSILVTVLAGSIIGGTVLGSAAGNAATGKSATKAAKKSTSGTFVPNTNPAHEAGESAVRAAQENAGQVPTVP